MDQLVSGLTEEIKGESRLKVSQARKSDCLFQLSKLLTIAQKSAVIRIQTQIESLISQIATQGASAPLRRLMRKVLVLILNKGNQSKINQNTQQYLRLANSLKNVQARNTCMDLLAQLFLDLGTRMNYPPLQQTLDLCKRVYKNSAENPSKNFAIKTIDSMVTSRPPQLSGTLLQQVTKFLIKAANQKQTELKSRGAKALTRLVKNFPLSLDGFYDLFIHTCVKGMEQYQKPEFSLLLSEGLSIQILPSFVAQDFTYIRNTPEYFPKNIMEGILILSQLYGKHQESKGGLVVALDDLLKRFSRQSIHSVTQMNVFISLLLNFPMKALSSDFEQHKAGFLLFWVFSNLFSSYLTEYQVSKAFDFAVNKLSTLKPLVHDSGIIQTQPAAKKTTDPITVFQTNLILKSLPLMTRRLTPQNLIPQYYQSLHKPILALLSSQPVQKSGSQTLSSLASQSPQKLFVLLSTLVAHTSVAHAQLTSLKNEPTPKQKIVQAVNSLRGNSLSLGSALKKLVESDRGVPNQIAQAALASARTLISGEYQAEVIYEQNIFSQSETDFYISSSKREAGWLIMEGLVYLGNKWVGSILTTLFALWKLPFGKASCNFDDSLGLNLLQMEVSHKKLASSALLAFMQHNQLLLNPQVYKLITVYIMNTLQFESPPKKSVIRKQMNENPAIVSELRILKLNLLRCLSKIPLDALAPKITLLLQPLCNQIISQQTSQSASIWKKWLNSDDNYTTFQPVRNKLMNYNTKDYHEQLSDIWSVHTQFNSSVKILDCGLKVFSILFTCSSFTITNRIKCFSYFQQHLTSVLKQKGPAKYHKVTNILLATVGALRQLSLSKGVITDQQLIQLIRDLLTSVQDSVHPMVKRIYSQGMIYLCKVIQDPQYIPVFIKEIQHRIILSEQNPIIKSSIVMLIANMYRHFDIQIVNRIKEALCHYVQNISNDPKVGGWAIHALYLIYSMHGNEMFQLVQATLPIAFHHYFQDYRGDFSFPETMVLLCTQYLIRNKEKRDSMFTRAMMVWEDMWEISKSGLRCGGKLIEAGIQVDLQLLVELALSKVPRGDGVQFLQKLVDKGFGLYILEKQTKIHIEICQKLDQVQEKIQEKLGNLLLDILRILNYRDFDEFFLFMKTGIQTQDIAEQEQEEQRGLSAQDQRKKQQQKPLKSFKPQTKIILIKILRTIIKQNQKIFQQKLQQLIGLSGFLGNQQKIELKISGIKLIKTLYKKFPHIKLDQDTLQLQLYQTQISTIIRQTIKSINIKVKKQGMGLLEKFLVMPGSKDPSVIRRILLPLLEHLHLNPQIKLLQCYTLQASATVFFKAMLVLSKVYLNCQNFIREFILQHREIFQINLEALVCDLSVIFTQNKIALKNYQFMLLTQAVQQDHPHLGYIHVFVKTLACLTSEKQKVNLIAAYAVSFMFITNSPSNNSLAFQKEEDFFKFLKRREFLLEALEIIVPRITDSQILTQLVHCLSICGSVPILTHQKLVLTALSKISSQDGRVLDSIQEIVKGFLKNKTLFNEAIQAWHSILIQLSEISLGEITDQFLSIKKVQNSIMTFAYTAVISHSNLVLKLVQQIWEKAQTLDFKRYLSSQIIQKMIILKQWNKVFDFMGKLAIEDLKYFQEVIQEIWKVLKDDCEDTVLVMSKVMELAGSNSGLYKVLLPAALDSFKYPSKNPEKQVLSLKLLLMIFRQAQNKEQCASLIIPMLFSLYSVNSTPDMITAVSKTLQSFSVSAPQAFRSIVLSMPDHEKKYLQNQFKNSQVQTEKVNQPTITLQMKLRKP